MTSTFSTVVNFSILEFGHKINRIFFLNNTTHELKDDFVFPRTEKKIKEADKRRAILNLIGLPTEAQLLEVIHLAWTDAVTIAVDIGIVDNSFQNEPSIGSFVPCNQHVDEHDEIEDEVDDEMNEVETANEYQENATNTLTSQMNLEEELGQGMRRDDNLHRTIDKSEVEYTNENGLQLKKVHCVGC